MLYVSIISLFILASTTLYFMIKNCHNKILVFLLTPILILASLLSYTTITMLEGSPIKGYPVGDFSVVSANIMKPNILIVIKRADTQEFKLHLIPFSQSNANSMNREKQLTAQGIIRNGAFERNKFGEMRYVIKINGKTPMPPKDVPPNQQNTSAAEDRRPPR